MFNLIDVFKTFINLTVDSIKKKKKIDGLNSVIKISLTCSALNSYENNKNNKNDNTNKK